MKPSNVDLISKIAPFCFAGKPGATAPKPTSPAGADKAGTGAGLGGGAEDFVARRRCRHLTVILCD
jgi:hypothetical protein